MWGHVQFSSKTPGKGKERFVRRPEERMKWALRRVYYAQWGYRDGNGKFGPDLVALGLKNEDVLRVKGWSYPPAIKTTDSLFEASYVSRSGVSWRIRQDGLVWKEAPRKRGADKGRGSP